MRILIAEDESDINYTYKTALESRNHDVVIADNGTRCIELYRNELLKGREILLKGNTKSSPYHPNLIVNGDSDNIIKDIPNTARSPFDVVVLDYKMPGKNGIEVAKEILDLNPNQRIIFASAYVQETLETSVKQLKRVVELLQKPFHVQAFIDTIEDLGVYEELKKMIINIRAIDDNSSPKQSSSAPAATIEQMRDMFQCLRKIQKNRTF